MKRKKFTFTACCTGAHNRSIKAICLLTKRKKRHTKLPHLLKALRSSSLLRTGAAACLVIALGLPARAQQPQLSCNVFQNADAANPITKLLRPGEYVTGLDFVDVDADGDLDCYIKADAYYSFPVLFRNEGTAALPVYKRDDSSGFQSTANAVYSYSDVQFADLDGDGDFDCFIGESYTFGGTTIHYFENEGTAQNPVFVSNEARNPLGFAYAFYGIRFTLADVDEDGDLDVAVTPEFGFYGQTVFLNTGTPASPRFDNGHRDYDRGQSLHRTYYDWNKDGLNDFFDDGVYYRNIGPRKNPKYVADSTGPQFQNDAPYRFADLNNDGFPEVFNFDGGYSTLAPVAVIGATPGQSGGFTYTQLTSTNQSPGYTYQWKFNGKDIPGATRPTYAATRKGAYILALTGTCGTGLSLPYVLRKSAGARNSDDALIAKTTGIHSSVFMQAFPNPFTGSVTLRIAQPAAGGSLIKVCDVQGRVLFTKQSSNAVVQVGETLSRGMYVVQVWQKNGLVFSGKVVKE